MSPGTVWRVVFVTAVLTSCGGREGVQSARDASASTARQQVTIATTEVSVASVPILVPSSSQPRPVLGRRQREYQPGLSLTIIEATGCENGPRPAMVSVGSLAEEFATRGYVGVVVETRRPAAAGRFDAEAVRAVRSAVHDMSIAVQWLRAHADEECVRPDAIAATGYSFGAIAALALAYGDGELVPGSTLTIDEFHSTVTIDDLELGPVPPELVSYSNDVDGVVSFAGFAMPEQIDPGEPPAILFHGRFDPTVPFSLAEKTCAAAAAVDVTCELVPRDAGHGLPLDGESVDQAVRFLDREMLSQAGLVEVR